MNGKIPLVATFLRSFFGMFPEILFAAAYEIM
jgi:hypothetical protein